MKDSAGCAAAPVVKPRVELPHAQALTHLGVDRPGRRKPVHPQQAQTCEMIRHCFVLLLLLANAVRGNMSPRVPAPASSGRPGQVLKDEADALHQRGKAVPSTARLVRLHTTCPGELKASFTPPKRTRE